MSTSTICLEQLQEEIELLKKENTFLKEQLEWFRRQIFGKRSEKFIPTQDASQPYLTGFEAISAPVQPKQRVVAAHLRKAPSRQGQDSITLPPNLPVETHVIDIPEDEKVCQETGLPLTKIGEEVTRKLAHRAWKLLHQGIHSSEVCSPSRKLWWHSHSTSSRKFAHTLSS